MNQSINTLASAQAALIEGARAIADKFSGVLLDLARIPSLPARGQTHADACARMLNAIAERKSEADECLSAVNAASRRFAEGQREKFSLMATLAGTNDAHALSPYEHLFDDALADLLHRLTALLCDNEDYISAFSLSAARIAKKADADSALAREYEKLIDTARIRWHDLAMNAAHIRKEFDHVKIHSGS